MKLLDLFNIATEYAMKGDFQQAVKMWNDCIAMDELFGPAHLNLFNFYKEHGGLPQAKAHAEKLFLCPLNWKMFKILPQVENEYNELCKKMMAPPPPPPPQ